MPDRATVTAVEAAARRASSRRRSRRRRVPKQHRPTGIARDYASTLGRIYDRSIAGLGPLRDELPKLLARVEAEKSRSDAGEVRRIRQLIEEARKLARNATKPVALEKLAKKFAAQTSTFQRRQLARQVRAALGVDVLIGDRGLAILFDVFAAENAALIQSVGPQVIDRVARLSTRAVASGRLWKDLAKDIARETGVGERRAKLIARDQVGKLYGQVNAQRQKNLGVTHFIWRTSNDGDRVREEHQALEGRRFPIGTGAPGEGLPGEPVLCRCNAEPDFSDILGA